MLQQLRILARWSCIRKSTAQLLVEEVAETSDFLQSEECWGMCLGTDRPRDFALLVGESIMPLTRMERTTAECLAESERRKTMCTADIEKFKNIMRKSCLDGAKSNPNADAQLARDMSEKAKLWPTTCEGHFGYNNRNHTQELDECTTAFSTQKHFSFQISFLRLH